MGDAWDHNLKIYRTARAVKTGDDINDTEQGIEIIKELRNSDQWIAYALEPNGASATITSWNEMHKDMIKFSKKYPHLIFEMYVEGSINSDMSYHYFKNGKVQDCLAEIDFPPYNPKKLKVYKN